MSDKDYNNVEITEEEREALNNFSLEDEVTTDTGTTESETVEETVQPVESTESEEAPDGETDTDDVDGFEIDGERYDLDTIKSWREDSENKSSWQKSNTEKSQNLSKWGKLGQKINMDEEFRQHINDYFYDDPEAIKALGLDKDIELPSDEVEVVPYEGINPEIDERLKILEEVEGERIYEARVNKLDSQLTTLENKFPEYLEGEKVMEFLDYADKNANLYSENGIPNLDRAFKEWSYTEMQAELAHFKKLNTNKSRNQGKIINTSQVGAKEVKSPKRKMTWNDVTMDNPEIAEYFKK
jgi:hypothetical protein